LIVFFSFKIYFNTKVKIKDYKHIISLSKDSLYYYKTKNDEIVAEKKVINLTLKEFKETNNVLFKHNSQLKKDIKGYKNLVTYLEGKLSVQGHDTVILTDTAYILSKDTIRAKKFDYTNSYLTLHGIIHNNTFDFHYFYNTDFTYKTYWKRESFLKQKILVMDFVMKDSNAKLSTAQTIQIKPPPTKFYQTNWFWTLTGFLGGLLIK
jgi:hypothetical protein